LYHYSTILRIVALCSLRRDLDIFSPPLDFTTWWAMGYPMPCIPRLMMLSRGSVGMLLPTIRTGDQKNQAGPLLLAGDHRATVLMFLDHTLFPFL
jgi:hypothetical protein